MKTDICPSRDDAQPHVFKDGVCEFCYAKADKQKSAAVFFKKDTGRVPVEYKVIPGFYKPDYAYELPLWIAYLRDVDLVVIDDLSMSATRLERYKTVYGSVMDANLGEWKWLVGYLPDKQFLLGGYVDSGVFRQNPNVTWMDKPTHTMPDYTVFKGTKTIPRLELSYGCKYNCAFCSVYKGLIERPEIEIWPEVWSMADNLVFEYVYIGDKTFGQASNHTLLPTLANYFSKKVPNFKGFIIQTTSSDLLKLDPDWMVRSKIKFVEIGLESYNDHILAHYKKPSREAIIDRAFEHLRSTGILMIPNIVIGFPQETLETYQKTHNYLYKNIYRISHLNIYNMAVYENARDKSKLPVIQGAGDTQENSTVKSWGDLTKVNLFFEALNEGMLELRYGKWDVQL